MTPLREAFCALMATVPGPDATEYTAWARSSDPDEEAMPARYVRYTARAIRSVGGRHHVERSWLPILDALGVELATKVPMPEGEAKKLVVQREVLARMLRAREVAETALDAVGANYDDRQLERAAEAVQWLVGGCQ